MRMWEHFMMGGWIMWFILSFGVLTVGAAARFAWRGEHQLSEFVRWMTLTTLATSFLGWGSATIKVLSYVVHQATPGQRWMILAEGTMEALNVPTFGLLFTVLACLLLAVGYRRFPTPNPSSRLVR